MKITELSLKRPSSILVMFISLFILGIFSYAKLPADLLPKMEFPYVAVMVPYPGAGPEDVEKKVTKPLEDAMSSLNNLDKLSSFSQEGLSLIWIEFKLDADPNLAVDEVQRKYNTVINELPVEVEPAAIQQFSINDSPIMQMSLTGNYPEAELFNLVKNDVQPRLQQVKGVSRVVLLGGKEREIRLEVQPDRLEAYNLSLLQVMQALQGDNLNVPAGKVEQNGNDFVIRLKSQVAEVQALGDIIIARTAGGPVYLRDIARVHDTFKDENSLVRLNGEPGIGLLVFKRSDANTITTSQQVKEASAEIEQQFGVQTAIAYNSAEFIQDALIGIQEELVLAILIVALIIFVFLGTWRSSLIILLSIPLSLVSTLIFVKLFGFSLNLMSLMGAALVVGIVVDDSIVVLENIQRHMEKGVDRLTAALESSKEIGLAVAGISLTLVVVFLPVTLVPGIAGKVFREFGLVVVCATLFSLLVALTLIPLLTSRWSKLNHDAGNSLIGRLLNLFNQALARLSTDYEKGIRWSLRHKKTVLAITLSCFLGTGLLIPLQLIGTEFIPKVERGEFVLKLTAPPGTSLKRMDSIVQGVEREVCALTGVKDVFTSIGFTSGMFDAGSGSNTAELRISLKEAGIKNIEQVKQAAQAIADAQAGLESTIVLTSLFGGAEDADLRLEVRGANLDRLMQTTELVQEVVAATPGTKDVRTSIESGLPEYNIRVDRETAATHGILTGEVVNTLGLYLTGKVVGKYSDAEDQYDVRLIAAPESRDDTRVLADLLLTNHLEQPVKLGQVAKFSQEAGLKKIERIDRQRVFIINTNLEGLSMGDAVREIKERLQGQPIPPDVEIVFGGYQEMFEDSIRDLSIAMLLSSIFIYLIMVALFESFLLPLTIWFSVPMAMIGAFLALALTQQTLNIISMVGLIMLVGLVTKNAILLVDFANTARKQGLTVEAALVKAGSTRLRPILMTTAAMVLAMLPLAMGLSSGSELRQGMSIALIGGLLSSTALTLFVIPVIYSLLESLKEKVGRIRSDQSSFPG